ncbi:MAG TPA: tripartite tricarboxylate transporter substrate binding protein [Candidatus Limnocylindria bacterium]|nr:tripartite tricarboxylate transporter substrate binding protein [Candidatus Limnocylindria bacterium]
MVHSNARRLWAVLGTALFIAAACGGGTTPAAGSPSASAAASGAANIEQPKRPVEFVISTGPGGGSDIYARAMQAVIEKQKLSPQPVQPTNKEGGSGAVAFTYVFEKKGDMHYIMITLNSFFTTIITQKLPYKATDFTPVANLALDPFFLWVNEDSPWKTAADLIKAAQDKELVASGTGSKQEDEVLFRRIEQTAKTKPFKYVPQSGGGAVATALAGHQGGVEVTVNNPSEGLGLMQQKKVRPLCSFTPDSPAAGPYKGLATCKSQGLAIDDYFVMRAILAPPDLKPAQQAFWVDVFKKVYESAEWKKFMEDNNLQPDFKSGIDFRSFINNYQKLHEDIAKANKWV